VCGAAEKKATQDPSTTLILGISAGALIGFGALLMSCVVGALYQLNPVCQVDDP
jgi:formate/nitrite transporter FocA (FNT family)